MKTIPSWAASLATFLLVACGESSFSAGQSRGEAPRNKEPLTSEVKPGNLDAESPGGTNSSDCTSNPQDRTQVRLLTDAVKNNATNQIVRYELWLVDCYGNPKPIPKAPLLFDINAQATFDVSSQKVPFVIQNEQGASVTSGKMNLIRGSDLFGVKGNNYFHWRIDEFSFDNTDKRLYLNLDVSNLGWQPFSGDEARSGTEFTFTTYLKIGDANPVEQKVKWTN